MANRTYLIQSDSPKPSKYDPDLDILAGASNQIPIFWYALFDGSCVVDKPVELDDGTFVNYSFLVTTVADAKRRLAQRKELLFRVFSRSMAGAFDDFCKLLDSVEKPHVHLETIELWMLFEADFSTHVENCIGAFSVDKTVESPLSSHEWRELLDQAQIDPKDVVGTTERHHLTGYGWVRAVPWKE